MTLRLHALAAAALLALSSGCRTMPNGASYSMLGGTLEVTEPAPYGKTLAATMSAMTELNLRPDERDKEGFRTFIVGEAHFGALSQTHEIRVWVTKVNETSTRIEMRFLGRRDHNRLLAIQNAIEKRLGVAAPAATTAPTTAPAATSKR